MKLLFDKLLSFIEIVNSGRQSDTSAMVNDRVTGNTFTRSIRIGNLKVFLTILNPSERFLKIGKLTFYSRAHLSLKSNNKASDLKVITRKRGNLEIKDYVQSFFVSKIVLTFWDKNLFLRSRKTFEI